MNLKKKTRNEKKNDSETFLCFFQLAGYDHIAIGIELKKSYFEHTNEHKLIHHPSPLRSAYSK